MNRRDFLKQLGLMGITTALPMTAMAGDKGAGNESEEFVGILVDTTKCLGCRTCEHSCAEANGLPPPAPDVSPYEIRKTSAEQFTVVNSFASKDKKYFAKQQCMHCNQPACASACLTKAMLKTKSGPVIWRKEKCMGCRFCMLSCPFDVPKFEYSSNMPRIRKCTMCFERQKEGKLPACVENCPGGALTFGKRRELIDIANSRIYGNSGKSDKSAEYVHYIYGNHEAGGTGVMYIAAVPFDESIFKKVDGKVYPELTKGFLYSVPAIFLLWPAIMLGINKSRKDNAY